MGIEELERNFKWIAAFCSYTQGTSASHKNNLDSLDEEVGNIAHKVKISSGNTFLGGDKINLDNEKIPFTHIK